MTQIIYNTYSIIYGLAAILVIIITIHILLFLFGTFIILFFNIFTHNTIEYKWSNIKYYGGQGLLLFFIALGVLWICYFVGLAITGSL
jgi:hypothetical protein